MCMFEAYKFLVFKRLDVADIFIRLLESYGDEQVKHGFDADYFLYHSESIGKRRDKKADLLKRIPGFIYPHNARAYPSWDGLYDPLPVQCNFVLGRAAVESMKIYGYPYRVEAVGFPYFPIRPFAASTRSRLLFVPGRLYPGYETYRQDNDNALAFILKHRESFEKIMICRSEGQYLELESNGNLEVVTTYPRRSTQPLMDMVNRIDESDIVISLSSTAVIAAARGKGVVMYGKDLFDRKGPGVPKHIDQYRKLLLCPYQLEDMSIDEILAVRGAQSPEFELWKRNNVGEQFDVDKFLRVIWEYVA